MDNNQEQPNPQIISQYIVGSFLSRGFQYTVKPSFEKLEQKGYVTTVDVSALLQVNLNTARKLLRSKSLGYVLPRSNQRRIDIKTLKRLMRELGIDGSEESFLTTGEVAEILQLSPRTVSRLYDAGELTGFRVPLLRQERRISRRSLDEFMQFTGIEKEEKYFTTGEVAEIIGQCPRTVAKLFDTGKLRGYKIPGEEGDRRISRTFLLEEMRQTGYYDFCLRERQEMLKNYGLLPDKTQKDASLKQVA